MERASATQGRLSWSASGSPARRVAAWATVGNEVARLSMAVALYAPYSRIRRTKDAEVVNVVIRWSVRREQAKERRKLISQDYLTTCVGRFAEEGVVAHFPSFVIVGSSPDRRCGRLGRREAALKVRGPG